MLLDDLLLEAETADDPPEILLPSTLEPAASTVPIFVESPPPSDFALPANATILDFTEDEQFALEHEIMHDNQSDVLAEEVVILHEHDHDEIENATHTTGQ